ncbi:MAG: CBS domain-containing protein [Deltaproteobacteria bacterium]|nr:CBS domain-containing protein [Deltaproteobacteria bacterium]MBW2138934.1 CBS domain-containing protein [Deltaproteobacteria bacterium]
MQIISTHRNTDFDGLASIVAAAILYPNALPVVPQSINSNVKAFISVHKDILELARAEEIDLASVTSLIVVDTNSWYRLEGLLQPLRERDDLEILLWDHHPGMGDIASHWQLTDYLGATVTLMVRRIMEQDKPLSPIHATLFLAGIYEDTGNLTFPATTVHDLRAAAFLMEKKANLSVMNSFLRQSFGQKQKDILFEMLKNSKRLKINGCNIGITSGRVKEYVGGLSAVVQMCLDILNTDAVFGIFDDHNQDKCILIARSTTHGPDIGALMRQLGGGGHTGAGSAVLKGMGPEEIAEKILNWLRGENGYTIQVRDLMSSPVYAVGPQSPMKDAALLLREKGCTGIPVVENDTLVGILSRRDFKKIRKEKQLSAPVRAFMTSEVKWINPWQSPVEAARLMVKHDIGRLPVLEKGRIIIGILTRSDCMKYFYHQLHHSKTDEIA